MVVKQIAARDDIRAAEEDEDVAISVTGLVDQLNRFVVEEELLVLAEEGFRRPCGERPGRRLSRRRAHALEDVLVRQDARALEREAGVARRVSAERPAGWRRSLRSRRCDRRAHAC